MPPSASSIGRRVAENSGFVQAVLSTGLEIDAGAVSFKYGLELGVGSDIGADALDDPWFRAGVTVGVGLKL